MLEMVLRGEIEKPLRFLVMNADPGMEGKRTERTLRRYRQRCAEAGIDMITAPGPSLYNDLVSLPFTGGRRIDNPPFWTKDENGKRGKLLQKCTQVYKVAPMDRAIRRWLMQKHAITQGMLRPGLVEKWIGFAQDEWHRCSESDTAYIQFRFPLIERQMDKAKCVCYFLDRGLELPQRSVCVACFANGLDYFKNLYENEPDEWEMAVEVDNSVEQWKRLGITEQEVYVSSSLVRLRDLPAMSFGGEREDMSEHHCNSGSCFL